jgi:TPP-dependent indolepyruvate ferredoxin oxidoreductase alpha subunit
LSPETLLEESDWERLERQRDTGVLGSGLHVVCRPDPTDAEVQQVQHRAVCILRPYLACSICPHQSFTLVFRAQPKNPYELVSCPRWKAEQDRIGGAAPDSYIPVERALCSERPFSFCPSCPSEDVLTDLGADKVRAGWYGRWRRFTTEETDSG